MKKTSSASGGPDRLPKGLRSVAAFTVLEVAMAASVLVLIIATTLTLIQAGFNVLDDARMSTLASQVLQSQMEQLRCSNFTVIQTYSTQAQPVSLTLSTEGFTGNFAKRFTGSAVSATFTVLQPDTAGYGEISCQMTVTWSNLQGVTRTRSYYTIFSDKGLTDNIATGFNTAHP